MAALTAAALGALGAGVGVVGNLGSSIYSTERNIANANYNIERQMQFEKEMASTQYQRAVRDMEAAGLNPGAVGASMQPAASASGNAATGNYGRPADFGNLFSNAVAAAMANDRNVSREIIQEMKSESALQVQRLRNQGFIENELQKKQLGHSAYSQMDLEDKRAANNQLTEYWKQVHGHRAYAKPFAR